MTSQLPSKPENRPRPGNYLNHYKLLSKLVIVPNLPSQLPIPTSPYTQFQLNKVSLSTFFRIELKSLKFITTSRLGQPMRFWCWIWMTWWMKSLIVTCMVTWIHNIYIYMWELEFWDLEFVCHSRGGQTSLIGWWVSVTTSLNTMLLEPYLIQGDAHTTKDG